MNAATLTRNLLPVFTAVLSGCCMNYHAHGAIIFNGNPTNVSLVTNGANGGDGQVSSGAASDPLFFSPIGGSNSTGFSSTDDIQILNGGSIVATDIVTYTLTITDTEVSTTNASSPGLSFWGHEMGLASAGGAFRTNPNAFVVVDARGSSSTRTNLGYSPNNIFSQVQNSLPGTTPAGEGITVDSLLDGYTIEIAYSAGGVTTVLSDVESSGTAATTVNFPTEPWPVGTDFVDYMNNAHFYVTAQGGGQFNVGAATIDVSRIPEPTSLALLGLGFFGLAARRR